MKEIRTRILSAILIFVSVALLVGVTSCVSQKKYNELEKKHREIADENRAANNQISSLKDSIKELSIRNSDLESTNSGLAILKTQRESEYSSLETEYLHLTGEYENIQSKIDYLSNLPRTESNNAMLAAKDLELREKQEEISNLNKQKVKMELDWAELSYYCPREVKEGEEFSLAVVISKVLGEEKLKDTLVKRLQFSDIELKQTEIKNYITSLQFKIGDSLRVSIEFDSEDFEMIVAEPRNSRKIVDDVEEWNWRLKAVGPGDHRITVTIETLEAEEWTRKIPRKSFPINVKVDARSYFYKLWEFIKEDPEWPIATLVIPIITFFAGVWKERRKSKEA